MVHTYNPSAAEAAAGRRELKTTMDYTVSLKSAKATESHHINKTRVEILLS